MTFSERRLPFFAKKGNFLTFFLLFAKKDTFLSKNLLKLNFFSCFFFNFFQAKKLKSPKKGQPLPASCILFHFIHFPLGTIFEKNENKINSKLKFLIKIKPTRLREKAEKLYTIVIIL